MPATLQEAVDPAWLAVALAPLSKGAAILSVEPVEEIRTMASKARIRVRFDDAPQQVHALCLKAFFETGHGASFGTATTIREAAFYRELSPHISMRVPQYVNAVVEEGGGAMLIMSDVIAAGAKFCSALEPFTIERAAQTLEQLAHLHAASQLARTTSWLPSRIDDISQRHILSVHEVQALLDDPRGEGLPVRTRSGELLYAGLKVLATRFASQPQTLLHGDCHAGNIYWAAEGPGFADWQLIQRGHWALDVAYHVAAVLPVALAEREESRLFDHYLDALRKSGGTVPDRATAWDDYRAAQIYGYYHWAISRRQDPAITREFTQRLGAGVTRHETYRLLGL